jgi:anti-sigma regulatory factor (Ser/Thr protein kinase)
MATVTLRLTPRRAHVRTARLVAAAMARRSGVAEELLDEVRLAVGEACGRAVQLHERYRLTELVVVTLADDDDRFKVMVRNLAPSKPGDDAPDPPDTRPADVRSSAPTGGPRAAGHGTGRAAAEVPDWLAPLDSGLDLVLLDALVDDLAVGAANGVPGTEVRMSWPLGQPASGSGWVGGLPGPQPD